MIILIASIVLGFFLRIVNLSSFPFFTDEAIYTYWAQAIGDGTLRPFIPVHDGKTILFVWSMIPFLKLGISPFLAGRIISAFSFLGSAFLLWLIAKNLFGKKYAWIPVLLYAVNPFSVFFDRMAIMDPLMTTFMLGSVYGLLKTTEKGSLRWASGAGILLALSFLSKPTVQLLLPFYAIVSIYMLWKFKRKGILPALLLLAPTLLAYGSVMLSSGAHAYRAKSKEFVYPLMTARGILINNMLVNLPNIAAGIQSFLTPLLGVYVIMGIIVASVKKKWRELFLSIILVGILVALLLYGRVLFSRHLYFLVPLAILIASLAIITVHKWNRIAGLGMILLLTSVYTAMSIRLVTMPLTFNFSPQDRDHYIEGTASGYGLKEIEKEIRNRIENGKATIITTRNFGNLPYTIQFALQDNPNIKVVGTWKLDDEFIDSIESCNTLYIIDTQDEKTIFEPTHSKNINLTKLISIFKPGNNAYIALYQAEKGNQTKNCAIK